MVHYIYVIEKSQDGYQYKLFPGNSRQIPIGISIVYPTISKCRQALEHFRESGTLYYNHPELIKMVKKEGRFYFQFLAADQALIFSSAKGVESKYNYSKSVQCVIKHIQAKIKE